jgi:tRNA(fMet)-specific endonuclease VapC
VAGLVVVDTDLVIDYLRGKGPGAAGIRRLISERRLRLTAITAFELRLGTDFHPRSRDIQALLHRRTYPLTPAAALFGGEVAAELRAAGTPIGFADCLQAGVCLQYDLPFATRNRKHLDRIDGLTILDPGSLV